MFSTFSPLIPFSLPFSIFFLLFISTQLPSSAHALFIPTQLSQLQDQMQPPNQSPNKVPHFTLSFLRLSSDKPPPGLLGRVKASMTGGGESDGGGAGFVRRAADSSESWIQTHYRWVIMLGVLLVAFITIIVGGVCLHRHLRQKYAAKREQAGLAADKEKNDSSNSNSNAKDGTNDISNMNNNNHSNHSNASTINQDAEKDDHDASSSIYTSGSGAQRQYDDFMEQPSHSRTNL